MHVENVKTTEELLFLKQNVLPGKVMLALLHRSENLQQVKRFSKSLQMPSYTSMVYF